MRTRYIPYEDGYMAYFIKIRRTHVEQDVPGPRGATVRTLVFENDHYRQCDL